MATNFLKQMLDKQPEGPIDTKALISKIEEGYLVDQGTSFKTKKTFSPSSLVYGNGACPRYWFLAFSGADFTSDNSPYAVANMSSGTMAHERIQKAIEDSGIMVEKEKRIVSQDPPIFGFADAIVQWGEEQPVVEIKTMREEAFSYRKHAKPPNYHLMQLIVYMKVLGKKLGLLLYENKNSHELHAITVELTEEQMAWGEYAFDWMRKVRTQWESGEIPKKTYRSNSKVCKGCPLANTCLSADKGTIKIDPLEYLE
jgi:CRISPR/Cas system-associated exonuclease Cas4 (RecB family)